MVSNFWLMPLRLLTRSDTTDYVGGLVRTRKPKVGNVGKNNKAINKKGNAGRNNRKGSKKPSEKKALPSADDLDKEMDTCKC